MKELRSRYREIKDDLYFSVLVKNQLTEFQRGKRHVMMSRINDSNKPIFEMLNKYYRDTKAGKNPFAKGKTLHETLEDMKITDRLTEEQKGSDMDFGKIKEDMSHERPHIQEDFGVPEPNTESWTGRIDESLSDGVTDVEALLNGKKTEEPQD